VGATEDRNPAIIRRVCDGGDESIDAQLLHLLAEEWSSVGGGTPPKGA
jgi:hypothetical protein